MLNAQYYFSRIYTIGLYIVLCLSDDAQSSIGVANTRRFPFGSLMYHLMYIISGMLSSFSQILIHRCM